MAASEDGDPQGEGWIGHALQGRYRIVSELGRGGMGIVYLAQDERLGRRVVVKIPIPQLMYDADVRARFLREVEVLTAHEHPHIVRILDFGEHEGLPYAVVEYVGGGSLEDKLRQGRQSPSEVAAWLSQVAAALDSVHAHGALHRDVKPANILFGESGHAYLADFGIATAMASADADATEVPGRALTQQGVFVGSGAYAPPESIDRILTPAYDVYSLGVVAYRALTGAMPFQGDTTEAFLVAKATQDPIPLRETFHDVPGPCAEAVMQAIARDRRARPATCGSFAEAFARAAQVEPGGRGGALAVAVGVLAAAAAGGAWWLLRDEPAATVAPLQTAQTDTTVETARTVPPPAPAPPLFRAGSTPAEIEAALDLCRAHVGDCDPAWYADESVREVRVSPVSLDRTEVSNAAFRRFVEATGHTTDAERRGSSWDGPLSVPDLSWRTPKRDGVLAGQRPDHPVVHVTLRDARAYCAHAGARLPTEDEWERVARGPSRRVFPWGDPWSAGRAVWRDGEAAGAEPVGSRPAGAAPAGELDMAGNVWEWTSTELGSRQVLKGGSWRERNPANLRSAARLALEPDRSSSDVGFRCARDVPEWAP